MKNKKTIIGVAALLLLPMLTSVAGATSGTAPSVTVQTQPPGSVLVTATSGTTSQQWTIALPDIQWDLFKIRRQPPRVVPEINATAGTQALALVIGATLLGAEGLRRRRRSRPI